MDTDDTGHDAASDLPWDDDAPLPPYPVLATDPDPGDPSMHTPEHEELLALRELRRDLDRILVTEGQPHAAVVGAVSGLVASGKQRAAPVAMPDLDDIRERLSLRYRSMSGSLDFHASVGAALRFNAMAPRDVGALLAAVDCLTAENTTLRDRLQVALGSLELIHERASIPLAARSTP